MPPPEQERYAKKLKEISDRYTTLEDTTIRQMVGALHKLRKDIASSLVEAGGFEAYHLRQLQQNTNQMIDQFNTHLCGKLRTNFGEAYQLGGRGMVEPLQAAGIQGVFHQFDTAQLNAVMDFSADLIQQIDGDMRGKINNQIRLGVLGEQGPFKTMKGITDTLGVKSTDLRWGKLKRPEVVKGVAARAEAILRTEMTRVYNLAHHSQAQKTAAEIPEVRKRWIATGDDRTRDSHLNAHIRSKEKPVKVDQPFTVGTSKLMFPGDPAGPPHETINCRCRMISIYPEITGDVDTPLDKDIEKEKARREREEPKRRSPSAAEKEVKGEIAIVKEAYQAALKAGNTDEAEGLKIYLDGLQDIYKDERDINKALWDNYKKQPDKATPDDWRRLSNRLRDDGYDLYKKYSPEGIELHVMEKRGAKMDGYADVGGKVVQVRRGRFSVREADRMKGRIWDQAKGDLSEGYGKILKKAGFTPSDIARADFTQRRRLAAEVGRKEMTTTKSGVVSRIDEVPTRKRRKVVDVVDYDVASICDWSAQDPLNLPSIDAYRKMQLADQIESTRLP